MCGHFDFVQCYISLFILPQIHISYPLLLIYGFSVVLLSSINLVFLHLFLYSQVFTHFFRTFFTYTILFINSKKFYVSNFFIYYISLYKICYSSLLLNPTLLKYHFKNATFFKSIFWLNFKLYDFFIKIA